ncbi:hypothetical protein FRC19_010850 [Serendipita sp. 401]|nr:hypothetical protein FRC15_010990 [Serendipita sp. 397]KAG8802481.1 hypothetical protein FRC16_009485 [Serendipita sp. 398]KAG8825646.1 hypothetical protein FRC19_010850 [Serendipita sp. 401]KAG8869713.1 hypothetical protein FRC20_001037 [Serendipita sp. 405]KAG9056383.1 hypothetical protein FS842_010839 [Serendipita sp. 407]
MASSGRTVIFYGVPYALPPVGERRFRAPVSLEHNTLPSLKKPTVYATKTPEFCIQGALYPGDDRHGGAGSEDCLHLNIYAPSTVLNKAANADRRLPVLVYIHGGGFVYGNPLSWPFEHWIESFPDIIIVSVYYRLNIFGFLSTSDAGEALDYNVGFLDQREALKWVKKNIADFGGDPSKITINGQSAGGASVLLHLLANGGRQDLFHQAIAQSVYRPTVRRVSETKKHFEMVAKYAGCDIVGSSTAEQIDCLRQADVVTLVRAAESVANETGIVHTLPVVDGELFTSTPTQLINSGKISRIPVLAGATTDESFAQSNDLKVEMRRWYPHLTDHDIDHIRELCIPEHLENDEELVRTVIGEGVVRCGGTIMAEHLSRAGVPTYAYRFDEPNPTQDGTAVQHSAENWWMFQGSNTGVNGTYATTPFTPNQERFSKELMAYWVSFVRSGNPNTHALTGSPSWPKWDAESSRKRGGWFSWLFGPKDTVEPGSRMVLRQGVAGLTASDYESGSFAEVLPTKEFERCLVMSSIAERMHF